MDHPLHSLPELFAQLGLPAGTRDIDRFCATHRPLAADVRLPEASFWTPTQSALLQEKFQEDADWTYAIDQLDLSLRQRPEP